jgi:hypothetical protein
VRETATLADCTQLEITHHDQGSWATWFYVNPEGQLEFGGDVVSYDDGEGRESRVRGKAVAACAAYEALLALFSLFGRMR